MTKENKKHFNFIKKVLKKKFGITLDKNYSWSNARIMVLLDVYAGRPCLMMTAMGYAHSKTLIFNDKYYPDITSRVIQEMFDELKTHVLNEVMTLKLEI